VNEKGGIFQIRPHKEFSSSKGQERLLSLELLSELPSDFVADLVAPGSDHSDTRHRNAYDFMMSRRETECDPNAKRWNAGIRVSNFTSTSAPLCVRQLSLLTMLVSDVVLKLSSVGALLDYLVRERAMSDLEDESIRGLEVRSIATITL
jgi:DNA mismatch repair protein MSH5